jgi:signal peptidase I
MPKPNYLKKLLWLVIRFFPTVIIVALCVPIIGMAANEGEKAVGLKTIPVPVVGTGSMYPSLYWSTDEGGPEDGNKKIIQEYRTTPQLYRRFMGITIFGHTYLHRSINYGDMVAFKNAQTVLILAGDGKDTSAGFIKRVIGVPGDTIELRDGFVYKNGAILSEPYISSPRSTYGGTTLADCIKLSIPPHKYFVLGDNRKISADSRFELGLVNDTDIEFVLPLSSQKIYQSLWRDTSRDAELLGQPTLTASDFIGLVNQIRTTKNIAKLKLSPSLVKSATLRGTKMLENQKTNYSMKQAIADSGYTNIVLGEFVSHGHFTAQELLQNLLYQSSTAKQIENSDFSDLGVASVDREVNGCPTQIIVGHLGGYIPASYDQATIDSWTGLRNNLVKILPSWEQAKSYNNIDQAKLDSLLTILRRRLALANEIIDTMQKKAWFSPDQEVRIKNDSSDAASAESLANQLNSNQ